MDDEGLPLSSPLPLSQPAVQAPIENPDAIIPSETTGVDVDGITQASDISPFYCDKNPDSRTGNGRLSGRPA